LNGRRSSHTLMRSTKAGIVLGFSGALVALSRVPGQWLVSAGRWAAFASGAASVLSFWPRKCWTTDLRALRDGYLAMEPAFTMLKLLDTQILMVERGRKTLDRKGGLLKIAMLMLGVGSLLMALGVSLHS